MFVKFQPMKVQDVYVLIMNSMNTPEVYTTVNKLYREVNLTVNIYIMLLPGTLTYRNTVFYLNTFRDRTVIFFIYRIHM